MRSYVFVVGSSWFLFYGFMVFLLGFCGFFFVWVFWIIYDVVINGLGFRFFVGFYGCVEVFFGRISSILRVGFRFGVGFEREGRGSGGGSGWVGGG